jgi:hypothetical protein
MAFEIEKGVPRQAPNVKYPFADMQVGDSFLVPRGTARIVASAAVWAAARGYGKFSCRTVEGGVRVWRIE